MGSLIDITGAERATALIARSWRAGIAGIVTYLFLLCAGGISFYYGWDWGFIDFKDRLFVRPSLISLAAGTLAMFAVELYNRRRIEGPLLHFRPRTGRELLKMLAGSLVTFLLSLALLWLAFRLYRLVDGPLVARFTAMKSFLPVWRATMDHAWNLFLLLGLPGIIITRILQHDIDEDRNGLAFLLLKTLLLPVHILPGNAARPVLAALVRANPGEPYFGRKDLALLRGLLVKIIFIPVMTWFFVGFFAAAMTDISTVLLAASTDDWELVVADDLYDLFCNSLFVLDVGIGWSGYVATTRWLRSRNVSVDPSWASWLFTLACYPPLFYLLTEYIPPFYYSGFLDLDIPVMVHVLLAVYTAEILCTVGFGVMYGIRFSNLTHRGIITAGPFALVRHPEYAIKNLAWWSVVLPCVLVDFFRTGSPDALSPLLGLSVLSGLYFLRALYEERHLGSVDPFYGEYRKKVPFRFIPGIF